MKDILIKIKADKHEDILNHAFNTALHFDFSNKPTGKHFGDTYDVFLTKQLIAKFFIYHTKARIIVEVTDD